MGRKPTCWPPPTPQAPPKRRRSPRRCSTQASSAHSQQSMSYEPKVGWKGVPPLDTLGMLKFLPAFVLGPVMSTMIGGVIAMRVYTKGNTELYDNPLPPLTHFWACPPLGLGFLVGSSGRAQNWLANRYSVQGSHREIFDLGRLDSFAMIPSG